MIETDDDSVLLPDYDDDLAEIVANESDDDAELLPIAFSYFGAAKKRVKEPTVESLEAAIDFFDKELSELPQINSGALLDELAKMEILIPTEEFDYMEMQKLYSLVHSYRQRASYMYAQVNTSYTLINNAAEELRKIAIKVSGGPRHDKEGYAANIVLQLIHESLKLKATLDQISQQIKIYDQAQMGLSSLLKGHEALSRVNSGYVTGGADARYQDTGRSSLSEQAARRSMS